MEIAHWVARVPGKRYNLLHVSYGLKVKKRPVKGFVKPIRARGGKQVTVKTALSRFQIHDELTAPDESAPLIKSIQAAGGAVTKFVGVLAGAPAVLRAYTRMRSELR